MLELLLFLVITGALPVVINKTTEGHLHWINPHLRLIWTAIFAFFSLYLLWKPGAMEITMAVHTRLGGGFWGYTTCALSGALLLCGYYWLAGKMLHTHATSLKLVFSDSPVLTDERKELISNEIDRFRGYLMSVGFDPPSPIPPIQVSAHGEVGMVGHPRSPYGYTLFLGEQSLDDKRAIHSAYAIYVFNRLLKVASVSSEDEPNRWLASALISDYFINSYADMPPASNKGWDAVLWKLRLDLGKNFMDHALFYAVQLFDDTPGQPKSDFNLYFRERIERGLHVMDNPGLSWKGKLDALVKEPPIHHIDRN